MKEHVTFTQVVRDDQIACQKKIKDQTTDLDSFYLAVVFSSDSFKHELLKYTKLLEDISKGITTCCHCYQSLSS